uniref:Uncharacterized protein n=1 Tax=Anopheles farauti TaxID=69004 RepID=A0A182QLW4_9DIPT
MSFEMTVDSVIQTGRSLRCVDVSSVSLSPIVMSTRVSSTAKPLDRVASPDHCSVGALVEGFAILISGASLMPSTCRSRSYKGCSCSLNFANNSLESFFGSAELSSSTALPQNLSFRSIAIRARSILRSNLSSSQISSSFMQGFLTSISTTSASSIE